MMSIGELVVKFVPTARPQTLCQAAHFVFRHQVPPYGLSAPQYAFKINAFQTKFCVHIGQIFGVYRAEFECKKCRLIRRLCMQNTVVFNIYCTYILYILGTNLVYIIKAAERLNIQLNLTNLYILISLLTLKKGQLKIQNMQILAIFAMVLH